MIMNARFLHLDSPKSANLCMQSRNISKKFDLINIHAYPRRECRKMADRVTVARSVRY